MPLHEEERGLPIRFPPDPGLEGLVQDVYTRGASAEQAGTGAPSGARGGGLDWARILTIAGLALKDVSARAKGQDASSLMNFMLQEQGRGVQRERLGLEKERVGLERERVGEEKKRTSLSGQELELRQKQLTEETRVKRQALYLEVATKLAVAGKKIDPVQANQLGLEADQVGIGNWVRGLLSGHTETVELSKQTRAILQRHPEGAALVAAYNDLYGKDSSKALELFGKQIDPAIRSMFFGDLQNLFTNMKDAGQKLTWESAMAAVAAQGGPRYVDALQNPKPNERDALVGFLKHHNITHPGESGQLSRLQKEEQIKQPFRVETSRQTGLAAAELKETVERQKLVHPFIRQLFGLSATTTAGAARDAGLFIPDANDVEFRNIQEAYRHYQAVLTATQKIDEIVQKSPAAVGLSGKTASALGAIKGQTENFARLAGIPITASLDPKDYTETLRGLGIREGELQAQAVGLAYSMAVATGQRGQSVSDRDVTNMLKQIGSNVQDPVKLRQVLSELKAKTTAQFNTYAKVVFGRIPEFGAQRKGAMTGAPPTVEQVKAMSLSDLRQLKDQLSTLPKAVRDAIEERLKVLVP